MSKKETKPPVIHEGEVLRAVPTPQLKLATIDDCRREMAKVYREAKRGKLDSWDASRFVYILGAISKLIEIGQLEQRIAALEKGNLE